MKGIAPQGLGARGRLLLPAVAAGLAACGSPSAAAPTPSSSAAIQTTSATAAPTPTADPRNAAIVAAYLDATRAFVHAEKAMDPNDPALPATMTGQQLSTVKKNLIIDRASGLVARGDITPGHPHIVSIDGQTAVLRDCTYSALLLYDGKTGQPASGTANGPQDVGVTVTLAYVDGAWKESLVDGRFGSCAGY